MKHVIRIVTVIALGWSVAARADLITEWNQIGRDAASAAGGNAGNGANAEARALAIQSLAVNDAVVSITPGHAAYLGTVSYSGPASVDAAVAVASAVTLTQLFPAQAAKFSAALANDLGTIADGVAKTNGIFIGQTAATNLLNARSNDGSSPTPAPPPFLGSSNPGEWRPTPPSSPTTGAVQPFWAHVTPFVLQSGDQFRPGPPPSLNGQEYQDAINQVKSLGAADSGVRTADQTQIAQFWYPSSTVNWNDVARAIVLQHNLTPEQEARVFALVNTAMADARVAAWDTKFAPTTPQQAATGQYYDFWRPITAIQESDPSWTPLLPTPNHPSYISGHSVTGAAAAEVLRELFGDHQTFTIGSDSTYLPSQGITRTFTSLSQAEQENNNSRLYAGIHYSFDLQTGDLVGIEVGQWVAAHALAVPEPRAVTLFGIGTAFLIALGLRRSGSHQPRPCDVDAPTVCPRD
jgi:hypothetical protein